MSDLALTFKQPWADLVMAGQKDVENRGWPSPSTLPQFMMCDHCGVRSSLGSHASRCTSPERLRPDGPFPFRLWIHAGQAYDRARGWDALVEATSQMRESNVLASEIKLSMRAQERLGVLLGSVEVTGCHHADECWRYETTMGASEGWHCSRWAEPDAYHWTLDDPRPLDTPIPMRGRQKLWVLPEWIKA